MDKDTLSYVLASSNELLKDTLDTAKSLNGRALNIIRFAVPIFIGLLIYIVNGIQSCPINLSVMVIAVLAELILLGIFLLCFQAYNLYTVYPPGTTPSQLGYPHETSLENILRGEIESSAERIEWNEHTNGQMQKKIHYALKTIAITFPLLVFGLFLALLL